MATLSQFQSFSDTVYAVADGPNVVRPHENNSQHCFIYENHRLSGHLCSSFIHDCFRVEHIAVPPPISLGSSDWYGDPERRAARWGLHNCSEFIQSRRSFSEHWLLLPIHEAMLTRVHLACMEVQANSAQVRLGSLRPLQSRDLNWMPNHYRSQKVA